MADYQSRVPRFVSPGGGTFEVTTRTLQSRLLMVPSPVCRDLVIGVVGRALERNPSIQLHAMVFLSNHYNLLLTTPDAGAMSGFMCFVNSNIAREIGRLVGWRDRFWGRRYRPIEILDPIAQEGRLRYLLSQGVKEGLVSRPEEWPGASSIFALLDGAPLRGTWYDRTGLFNARRRAKALGTTVDPQDFATRYEIKLAPLPAWSDWSEAARRARIAELVRDVVIEGAIDSPSGPQARPLGVRGVLRQDPHGYPRTTATSPAPLCHATDFLVLLSYRRTLYAFIDAYRAASKRIREGARDALDDLPSGCFPPPHRFRTA